MPKERSIPYVSAARTPSSATATASSYAHQVERVGAVESVAQQGPGADPGGAAGPREFLEPLLVPANRDEDGAVRRTRARHYVVVGTLETGGQGLLGLRQRFEPDVETEDGHQTEHPCPERRVLDAREQGLGELHIGVSAGPEVVRDQVAAQHQPLDPTNEVRFIRLLERRADKLDRSVELTGVAARPGGVGQQLGARAGHRLRIRDPFP